MSSPSVAQPLFGLLPDLTMVDDAQAQLFDVIGTVRNPFGQMGNWPFLLDLLRQRSETLLLDEGEDAWRAAGGFIDDDGCRSLRMSEEIVGEVVREACANAGGFIWADSAGTRLAVKLLPGQAAGAATLAIALHIGGGTTSCPLDVSGLSTAPQENANHRGASGGHSLRLYRRAEQMLWALFLAVRFQRCSTVRLPDLYLGQIIFGGDNNAWPKNWRQEISGLLRSLSDLRCDVLRVEHRGWQPRLGGHSVAVAGYEHLETTAPHIGHCDQYCPVYQGMRHGHFVVQMGQGFLGALERYALSDDGETRHYDFQRRPPRDPDDEVEGRARQISPVARILGPSRWSGLGPGARDILDALSNEITRPRRSRGGDRADGALVFLGQNLPTAIKHPGPPCPFLIPQRSYVAFGGNGRRPGYGYRLDTWALRSGYVKAEERRGNGNLRQFLRDLSSVGEILGLECAVYDRQANWWYSLHNTLGRCLTAGRLRQLGGCVLQVFGPVDYADRLREYFRARGRFARIPGGPVPVPVLPDEHFAAGNIAGQLRAHGRTQASLAAYLGVSQSFVSQAITGRRAWPTEMLRRALGFLRGECL